MKVNFNSQDDALESLGSTPEGTTAPEPSSNPNPEPAAQPGEAPQDEKPDMRFDDLDALDSLGLGDGGAQGSPSEGAEQSTEPTPAPAPEQGQEPPVSEPEPEVDENLKKVLAEIENMQQQIDQQAKETEQVIQSSDASDADKQAMLSKNKELEGSMAELKQQYSVLEQKYMDKIAENETYKLDGAVNRRFVEKLESDPESQEYMALKIKSDAGDEKSKQRLEDFYKDQLSKLGFDIESLVGQKKTREKEALSRQTSSSPTKFSEKATIDDSDALDELDVS